MSDNALFLVSVVLWIGPSMFLAARMARAQHRYLGMYRQAHPAINLPESGNEPVKLFGQLDRVGNVIDAYSERQDDPELERVRLDVSRYKRLAGLWGFGGILIPVALFTVFG